MTTYLRAFNEDEIITASNTLKAAAYQCPNSTLQAACAKSINTPVNGEALCMRLVCEGWYRRASTLGLPKRGEKRERDREAYMQGALAALTAAGLMTVERGNQIAFLTAVSRLDQYMIEQTKEQ